MFKERDDILSTFSLVREIQLDVSETLRTF